MPRSKYSVASHRRRKKILKAAKGYFGGKHSLLKTAKESVDTTKKKNIESCQRIFRRKT